MSCYDPIFEGDLVMLSRSHRDDPQWMKKHEGKIGIVIDSRPCWPNDARDDEMIIIVLYSDSGAEVEWSDRDLKVINESR